MKKLLFLSLLLSVSILTYAENEGTDDNTNTPKKTTSCHPENFSHWSIAIGGGANLMLGENTAAHIEDVFGEYLKNNTNWAVKAEFEYMVNPVWGFNLQYMYDPYNKKNANANGYTTDRDLQMHEVTLQFMLNILNIGRRTRVHTNWNWFAGLGGGVLCYQRNQDFNYTIRPAAVFIASTSVEYTPTPVLGIFAEGVYRWYADDRVNGITAGQLKDMGLYGGLGLRFHLGATAKPHVRVTDVQTYEPICGGSTVVNNYDRDVEGLQAQIDELTRQLNQMSKTPQPVATAAVEVADNGYQDKVDSALNRLNAKCKDLDTRVTNLENGGFNTADDATVYFDINSAVIGQQYQLILAKIARRLQNNNSQKIIVRGYCDYRGDVPMNKELAQKRIDAVVYVLVNRYRIDRSRIAMECIGKIEGEEQFDLLNRRCDIIFK